MCIIKKESIKKCNKSIKLDFSSLRRPLALQELLKVPDLSPTAEALNMLAS